MIEKSSSIWETEAPAVSTVQVYMLTNINKEYWNITRLLTLCDVYDWKMY